LLKGVYRISLSEKAPNFKEYERAVQQACYEMGRSKIRKQLEEYDTHLKSKRDKSIYRHRELECSTINTVLGEPLFDMCW